ncbi:hypothetical protein ACFFLS_15240 [Flavobacterium procerum]|uniref:TonB C-terminal domain-containing protein n=1 Tax=Flavobacterium procerum TaxID=1455569 RepID=A0ABV6BTQ3_9FLAO
MGQKYKIAIPEPCHENWDKMTPNENGRFCMNCSKTVVDFTSMLPEEIQHYFIQNQNEKICGRFRKSQLEIIQIQIPSQVLYSQTNYHKIFLLALFIAMGTTLFSCQDKDGNKKKIDTVEVVEDSVKTKIIDKNSSLKDTLYKEPSQHKKSKTNINLTIGCLVEEPKVIQVTEPIYNNESYILGGAGLLTILPSYPGGIQKFYDMIQNRFELPRKAQKSEGIIQASFSVEKDGSMGGLKIINDIGNATGDELLRVLKTTPKWSPGQEEGKTTINYYNILVTIQKDSLNEKRRKRKFSKITAVKIQEINQDEVQ